MNSNIFFTQDQVKPSLVSVIFSVIFFLLLFHHMSYAEPHDSPEAKHTSSALLSRSLGTHTYQSRNRGTVARSDVEAVAQGGLPRQLAQVRLYPERKKGKFIGFKLTMIEVNSLAAQIGLKVGDVLMQVNGESIGRPEQMMHVLSLLPFAPEIRLKFARMGVIQEWVWKIEP